MNVRIPSEMLRICVAVLALGCATPARQPMTQERMRTLIEKSAERIQGQADVIEFTFDGIHMACISDVGHDRMRIIAPIAAVADLTPDVLYVVLIANFHTSLDGRYAVSDDTLYAAYLHPLSSLSDAQLASALRQVSSLVKTFGSTYSSGELTFGAESGEAL